LDWDVHHGNGIQRMFYSDPRVLYVSIHRYDHGTFFPASEEANYTYVGDGQGEGFNVNIPWNKGAMTDTEYLTAFTNVILPIAYEYGPELVLISAGFDAAKGDQLGGCKVTPEGYALMTHLLSPLANGKIILALEGGYNLTSIAYSMTLCTKALLGDPIPRVSVNDEVDPVALKSIRDVMEQHSDYWGCLKPYRKYFPLARNAVQVGKYETEETSLESKLNIEDDSNNNASPDEIITEPVPDLPIPETPIAAGEPSLSIPQNFPTANIPTEINQGGSGEDTRQQNDGAQAAITPGENEGAVGQTTFVLTIQEMAKLMINENAADGDQRMYLVDPLEWCPHVDSVQPVPNGTLKTDESCQVCRSVNENWICLICYSALCSRYVREHMVIHSHETGHQLALSCQDLSIWCFSCNNYVDSRANSKLFDAFNEAHFYKHGERLPVPILRPAPPSSFPE